MLYMCTHVYARIYILLLHKCVCKGLHSTRVMYCSASCRTLVVHRTGGENGKLSWVNMNQDKNKNKRCPNHRDRTGGHNSSRADCQENKQSQASKMMYLHATVWRGAAAVPWGEGVGAGHRGGTTHPQCPIFAGPACASCLAHCGTIHTSACHYEAEICFLILILAES